MDLIDTIRHARYQGLLVGMRYPDFLCLGRSEMEKFDQLPITKKIIEMTGKREFDGMEVIGVDQDTHISFAYTIQQQPKE